MKKIVLIFSILICLSACSRSAVQISETAGAERVIPTEKQTMDAETLAYDDDNQPPVDETLEKVKLGLHPGAVYLLHPESTTNTAMLGDMIDWIRSVGYEILPICDIE